MTTQVGQVPRQLGPQARPLKLAEPLVLCALAALLIALGLFGMAVSLPAAGAIYGVCFLVLSFVRIDLAVLLIIATTPFMWDIGGGPVKMAVSEISLILALPALVLKASARREALAFNPLWIPIAAYLAICCISTAINGNIAASVTSILQMVIYVVVAVFAFSRCVDLSRDLFPALIALLLVDCFLALALIITRKQYLFGLHKNAVGTILGYGVVIATELWFAVGQTPRKRRRLVGVMLGVLSLGLVFTLSRGAWIGSGCGVLLILLLRQQFKLVLRLLLIMLPLVALGWALLPEGQKEYATDFDATSHNIKARLESIEYAMTYFKRSPVIGVGVGLRKQYDATNLIMSTLAETGIVGLAAFLGIFATLAVMVWKTQRRLARTDVLFTPLVLGAALMADKFLHGLVDHYWGRGLLPVWGAAGLAAYAYSASAARKNLPARKPGDKGVVVGGNRYQL